ncbi:unnamed protein product [Lasius platythorax]|uniref:Uncharacterized protein n=1 Tax=Lasius platythorax TaxID=488582 RepID=A0AAV2N2Y2_9HYME
MYNQNANRVDCERSCDANCDCTTRMIGNSVITFCCIKNWSILQSLVGSGAKVYDLDWMQLTDRNGEENEISEILDYAQESKA